MFITLDPYYSIEFYNETKEALKNNGVQFSEFISTKPPFNFYIKVDREPMFVNYDLLPESSSRWLVNTIKPLKPNDVYIYTRRESYVNQKGLTHYAMNEPFKAADITKEGVFFFTTKDEVLRVSKEYPRKIWFMGKYFNNKYRLFFADKLIIKNYITEDKVLVESNTFKNPLDLEVELNYKIFFEKDRLEKLSETPYVLNGKYFTFSSKLPEISSKFVLS